MQTHEMLGQLPEQEVARYTSERIEKFAKRSKFVFVIDPTGVAVASYLSINNLALYRSREDTIVSAIYSAPAGFSLRHGSISFTPVIPDPFDQTHYIRAGAGESYFFLAESSGKTRFVEPSELRGEYDYQVQYPDPPETEVVMAASEDPESQVKVYAPLTEDESPSESMLREQAIAKAAIEAARKHQEDELVNRPLSRRNMREVEESRRRLLEINKRLDRINMENSLIQPPSRN